MITIALMSQKGGAGKTTLAIHLAVAAERAGKRTAIVDLDPQASATKWGARRGAALPPPVLTATAAELGAIRQSARAGGYALLIVDTPPHAAPAAATTALASDHIVIPCRPTPLDLDAVDATLAIVQRARRPATFVLSACPRGRDTEQVRAVLLGHKLDVAPGAISQRAAFARALATGQAVAEWPAGAAAAEEVEALWRWLWRRQLGPLERAARVGADAS